MQAVGVTMAKRERWWEECEGSKWVKGGWAVLMVEEPTNLGMGGGDTTAHNGSRGEKKRENKTHDEGKRAGTARGFGSGYNKQLWKDGVRREKEVEPENPHNSFMGDQTVAGGSRTALSLQHLRQCSRKVSTQSRGVFLII